MDGSYCPFNDGYGIVGYSYDCPICHHQTLFTACDDGCENCGFKEPYVDPDEWYDEQMEKPIEQRQWNLKPQS